MLGQGFYSLIGNDPDICKTIISERSVVAVVGAVVGTFGSVVVDSFVGAFVGDSATAVI